MNNTQTKPSERIKEAVENFESKIDYDFDRDDEEMISLAITDGGCIGVAIFDGCEGVSESEIETMRSRLFLDTVEEMIDECVADFGGSDVDWHYAKTGTRYAEITLECKHCDYTEPCFDCTNCQGDGFTTVKIRVSDHGSCYCSEDYSVAMNPSGDDHDIDYVFEKVFRHSF